MAGFMSQMIAYNERTNFHCMHKAEIRWCMDHGLDISGGIFLARYIQPDLSGWIEQTGKFWPNISDNNDFFFFLLLGRLESKKKQKQQ